MEAEVKSVHVVFDRGNGRTTAVIMRPQTIQRLKKTCFRGKEVRQAGNFCLWDSCEEMVRDEVIRTKLLPSLDEVFDRGGIFYGTYGVMVKLPQIVGWSSTVHCSKIKERRLKVCWLNGHAWAQFMPDPQAEAPQTHTATFVCELKRETPTSSVAVVHSLYPGPDVGELSGDMTHKTGMVWYGWNNPGSLKTFQD